MSNIILSESRANNGEIYRVLKSDDGLYLIQQSSEGINWETKLTAFEEHIDDLDPDMNFYHRYGCTADAICASINRAYHSF